MKSWTSLKESVGQIDGEVRQLQLVRSDMAMLQEDLQSQERLWRQAELLLSQENAMLRAHVQSLWSQVLTGEPVKNEVAALELQVADEERRAAISLQESEHEERQTALKRRFLEDRVQKLTSELRDLNATAEKEARQARERAQREREKEKERELQAQAALDALQLKAAELEDQLRSGQQRLSAQEREAAAKTHDLKQQIDDMQRGLWRAQSQLMPEAQLQGKLLELQAQIRQETLATVRLKQEEVSEAARCDHERALRQDALRAEQRKAEARRRDMTRLCDSAHGQHMELAQLVGACEGALAAAAGPAVQSITITVPR